MPLHIVTFIVWYTTKNEDCFNLVMVILVALLNQVYRFDCVQVTVHRRDISIVLKSNIKLILRDRDKLNAKRKREEVLITIRKREKVLCIHYEEY